MGRIVRPVRFGSEDGSVWVHADAAIDTGSTHCQIPESVAAQLDARLYRMTRVRLADGRIVERAIVIVLLDLDPALPPLQTTAFVADDGSPFLIGVVPLEQMGVGLDPSGDRLIPVVDDLLTISEWRTF